MNRRGEGDELRWNVAYLILGVLFFAGMFWFIASYQGQAAILEDFYVKEVVKVIDSADSGSEVKLDVSPLMEIARKNGRKDNEVFYVDNVNGVMTASVRAGAGKSFSYFNNVTVYDLHIESDKLKGEDLLVFEIR